MVLAGGCTLARVCLVLFFVWRCDCDVSLLQMRLMGEITLSVLYVTKLSCYWHDFCDQLSCIYGKELILHKVFIYVIWGELPSIEAIWEMDLLLNLCIVDGTKRDLLILLETLYFLITTRRALHRQEHSGQFIFTET